MTSIIAYKKKYIKKPIKTSINHQRVLEVCLFFFLSCRLCLKSAIYSPFLFFVLLIRTKEGRREGGREENEGLEGKRRGRKRRNRGEMREGRELSFILISGRREGR